MAQKSHSTIIERLKRTGRENELKSAEIQTAQGFRLGRVIPAKLVFQWLYSLLKLTSELLKEKTSDNRKSKELQPESNR